VQGSDPHHPLICGTVVLCAPYNVGVVDSFVYNTVLEHKENIDAQDAEDALFVAKVGESVEKTC